LHFPLTTLFKAAWNSRLQVLERLRLSSCYDSKAELPASTGCAPANMYLVWQIEIHLPITTDIVSWRKDRAGRENFCSSHTTFKPSWISHSASTWIPTPTAPTWD